jgi:hypothetical protein
VVEEQADPAELVVEGKAARAAPAERVGAAEELAASTTPITITIL